MLCLSAFPHPPQAEQKEAQSLHFISLQQSDYICLQDLHTSDHLAILGLFNRVIQAAFPPQKESLIPHSTASARARCGQCQGPVQLLYGKEEALPLHRAGLFKLFTAIHARYIFALLYKYFLILIKSDFLKGTLLLQCRHRSPVHGLVHFIFVLWSAVFQSLIKGYQQ